MNQDVNGNGKLFRKDEVRGNGKSCSRIKDGNERLALREDEVERI